MKVGKSFKSNNLESMKEFLGMAGLFGGILFCVILSYSLPEKIYKLIIAVVLFGIICYCDNSFIYNYLVKKLPKNSSLRKKIINRRTGDYRQQVYKTVTYFFLWLDWILIPIRFVTLLGCVIFPLSSLIRYIKHQDIIQFGDLNQGEFTPTSMTLLIPGAVLALRGIESNLKFPTHFWILCIICVLGIVIPFYKTGRRYKVSRKSVVGFIVCVFIYVFGILCNANMEFDFSIGQEYQVEILDKGSSYSRAKSYYVNVMPWDDGQEETKVLVSFSQYQNAEVGEDAYIYQKQGFLRMEWYYIEIR